MFAGTGDELCPAKYVSIDNDHEQQVHDFWNQIADIWNAVIDSSDSYFNSIPSPYDYDTSLTTTGFLGEVERNRDLIASEIQKLVTLRANGIPDELHAMSLRMGDWFDLEHQIMVDTAQSLMNHDFDAWNHAATLEETREDYLDRARAEIKQACGLIG